MSKRRVSADCSYQSATLSISWLRPLTLAFKVIYVLAQGSDDSLCFINRRTVFDSFSGQLKNPVLCLAPSTALRVNILAKLTFLLERIRLHDKFYRASVSSDAVVTTAHLAKLAPFPITTSESMPVVKTHVS